MRSFGGFFLNSPSRGRAVLILITTAGLLLFASSPAPKRLLGLNQFELWFMDSYAVLAASDAVQAGIDVEERNPLDILERPHSYTDWWFGLHRLGFTREHNFIVGSIWVIAFVLVAWWTLRPRHTPESLVYAAALLAPPVLLAINRANNDLVIFALLGLAGLALRAEKTGGWILALAGIALAAGLKIYPVVAAAVFFLVRPKRSMLIASSTAAVVLSAVLINVWPAIGRGLFALPDTLYTFGAAILLRDLGLTGSLAAFSGFVIIGLAALAFAGTRKTASLADASADFDRRILFVLAASVLVACFLAGASFGYRWIFAVWLLPWLIAQARVTATTYSNRTLARFCIGLLLVVLWLDGVFCVATNLLVGPMPREQLARWQFYWRLGTQPFTWLLMALLAGWLVEAATATLRGWRTSK